MKRKRLFIGSLVGVMLAGFLFVGAAQAHTFKTGDNVTFPQGEKIDNSLFVSGRNIDIASDVNGDIFCAGQTITISGNVDGDVICAAQTIRISGKVDGDVRLAAQTVSVSGEVTSNGTIATQTFTLDSDGKIGRDVSVGSQDVAINGEVGRDMAVGSTNVVVSGKVGRDIEATVVNMRLASTASVGGAIDYTSANTITQDSGSTVGGEVTRTDPPQKQNEAQKYGALFGFSLGWFLYWLIAMAAAALLLALIWPVMFVRVTNRAMPRPWKALLVGLVAGIVVPIGLVALLISVIGIPLAITFGIGWLLILLLSGPFTAFYIGRLILRSHSDHILLDMLVGTVLLTILYFIPVVGLLALLFVLWVGVGMLLLELYALTPRPSYVKSKTAKSSAAAK